LLPSDIAPGQRSKINHWELAPAISALYLGFSKPLREIGGQSYTLVMDSELQRARDTDLFSPERLPAANLSLYRLQPN
jgi:hypothetical protein